MNKVDINICIQVFLWTYARVTLGYIPEGGIFLVNRHICCLSLCTDYLKITVNMYYLTVFVDQELRSFVAGLRLPGRLFLITRAQDGSHAVFMTSCVIPIVTCDSRGQRHSLNQE